MAHGRTGPAEAEPYFFLSYSRSRLVWAAADPSRDRLVGRFHEDLRELVSALAQEGGVVAGLAEGRGAVGPGEPVLAEELGRCRVFVALYSADYFADEHCGREWSAFSRRLDVTEARRGRRPEAIVPVLWQPVPEDAVPPCARVPRYALAELGGGYLRYGLGYLLRHLPEFRAEYARAVRELARRIVRLAERESVARVEQLPVPAKLENAFARPDEARPNRPRLRIVVAAPVLSRLPRGAPAELYGERPTSWRPYLPDYEPEIATAARGLAESMDFRTEIEALEGSEELVPRALPTAPTLLLVDPWAAEVPALRDRLSRFDNASHLKLWIRPVVVWNRAHPAGRSRATELEARLGAMLAQCRRRYRPESPPVLDGLETVEEFVHELPAVIRASERRFLAQRGSEQGGAPAAQAPPRPRFHGPGPGFEPKKTHGHPDTEVGR